MAHTISTQRFNKFRLQLELLATHTSYNAEEFVFKYYYSNVSVPTHNYGDIRLHEVRYKVGDYFLIEYYIGNVRLLDSYPINENGELLCNDVIHEVISHISDCIDCLTILFTDKVVANDFMNSYLSISSENEDTIIYHYSGSDFIVVYTVDFDVTKVAWTYNKFFVSDLVDNKSLNSDNVKNFKVVEHYVDMVNSDKDTECGLM
jgi:hypothetical protein|nr:MAG TPA: hypothetical protein [Bacteriophage sp.]